MNKDEILLSKIVPHNRDYFTLPYDNNFTSKLLKKKRSWKDGAEQEERPFADNYESCLFVWPPRNYICNFCDREFRSAQALGGHMNIHRRDRARLQEAIQHPDQDDDHDDTTIHASTHERSNLGAINGLEKALISPTVCDLPPNPSEFSVGFLKSNRMEDDLTTVSAKRRRVNPLIEPQHQDVDLELRL